MQEMLASYPAHMPLKPTVLTAQSGSTEVPVFRIFPGDT